jgi:hypothetical protein
MVARTKAKAATALAAQYRREQEAVAAQLKMLMARFWDDVDPDDFADSFASDFAPAAATALRMSFEASAASASAFYVYARIMSGRGFFKVPGVTLDSGRIDAALGATGIARFWNAIGRGEDADSAMGSGLAGISGSSASIALDGGRATIVGASNADREAKGWERIAEAGACDFCLMLSGRGAVYSEATSDFPSHDNCKCVASPVFE